jgi:hypothetical protein
VARETTLEETPRLSRRVGHTVLLKNDLDRAG